MLALLAALGVSLISAPALADPPRDAKRAFQGVRQGRAMPLPMLELESGRLNATSKKRQVRSGELGCFDYRPDDRRLLIELGVCCQGAAAQHDTQSPTKCLGLAHLLHTGL